MRYNSRKKDQREKRKGKVIRCNIVNGPMFEYETCSQFSLKPNSATGSQQICKNCVHSF